jgi:hypothetical protein
MEKFRFPKKLESDAAESGVAIDPDRNRVVWWAKKNASARDWHNFLHFP